MKTALLRRTETSDVGTFGIMEFMGQTFRTGELPDRGNAENISSIPAGVYVCKWTYSPHFKRHTYELQDVHGRTVVRIHVGNWCGDKAKGLLADVDGCILLGYGLADIKGQRGVTSSADAIEEFEKFGAGDDVQLAIVDEYLEAGASPAVV